MSSLFVVWLLRGGITACIGCALHSGHIQRLCLSVFFRRFIILLRRISFIHKQVADAYHVGAAVTLKRGLASVACMEMLVVA